MCCVCLSGGAELTQATDVKSFLGSNSVLVVNNHSGVLICSVIGVLIVVYNVLLYSLSVLTIVQLTLKDFF